MAIKLLIDSASDITQQEAKDLDITVVPLEIRFGEQQYLDGIDLTFTEFYDKLMTSSQLPKTSQINPFTFEKEFEKTTRNGDQVIAITISSKLSGTYRSAVEASKNFEGKVFVVDSLRAAVGERLLGLYALRLISEGELAAAEIAKKLDEQKSRIQVIAMVDTLKYLKMGGRISSVTAFAGEVLSIKPVLSIVDGEVKMIGKALGSKKANNLLNTLVQEKGIDFDMPLGAVWSGKNDDVVKKYIQDSSHIWKGNIESVSVYPVGSTIGTHVGPGAVGVAFFQK